MFRISDFGFRILLVAIYGLSITSLVFAQEKIIAVVNNEVITQKDLNDFTNFMRMQISKEEAGQDIDSKIEAMKPDLLNKLIEDRLILQEAKKNKITIEENLIKARISEIKRNYPGDTEFQEAMAKDGLVQADIEARIREQALMFRMVEIEVRSKVNVKPDEVTSFYENNKNDFISPEEREFDAILLENQDLADTFSYNLKSGQKLEDLVIRYPVTIDTIRANPGGELRQDIEEAAFKLGVGESSTPIRVDDKYYIFILKDIKPARLQILSEVQEKIYSFLHNKKMQEGLSKWLDGLREKSYIKISQD